MSRRGPKHQHFNIGNRKAQRELSCEEFLQLAARALHDARNLHDRGATDLTPASKEYLRGIAADGVALATCRDCFPADLVPSGVAAGSGEPELGVEVDATTSPGALIGTDTEHVAARASELASNGEMPAAQKPTAHTQPIAFPANIEPDDYRVGPIDHEAARLAELHRPPQ